MFFSLIYKSSLWNKHEPKARLLRVFISGVVLYILLHSYLYSRYTDGSELIQKYRKYIFYIGGVDAASILSLYYSETKNKKKNKKKNKRHPKQLPYQMHPMMLPYMPTNGKIPPFHPTMALGKNKISVGTDNELQKKIEYEKQKKEVLNVNKPPVKTTNSDDIDNKSKELFITRDEINSKSIPLYNSTTKTANQKSNHNDLESIPIYKSKIEEANNIPIYSKA